MPGNPHAENPLGGRVNDQLGQPIRRVKCHGSARCAPWEFSDLDRNSLGLRLGFGQPRPRNFRLRKHHRWNNDILQRDCFSGHRVHCHARFAARLVGEQQPARAIANGVNSRVRRLLLTVDLDKSFFIQPDLGGLQSEVGAIR